MLGRVKRLFKANGLPHTRTRMGCRTPRTRRFLRHSSEKEFMGPRTLKPLNKLGAPFQLRYSTALAASRLPGADFVCSILEWDAVAC